MSQVNGITYTLSRDGVIEQWPFVPEHVVVLELTGHNPDQSKLIRWFARWDHEIFVEVTEVQFKALWQHLQMYDTVSAALQQEWNDARNNVK